MISDLYNLPESRLRSRFLSHLALLCGSLALFLLAFAQHFARALEFHPRLGPPVIPQLDIPPALVWLLGLTALSLLGLAELRRVGLVVGGLAAALLLVTREPLYSPIHLLVWLTRYESFDSLAPLCGHIATLVRRLLLDHAAVLLVLLIRSRVSKSPFDIHGSARWATDADVRAASLLARPTSGSIAGPPGLFLGFWPGRSLKQPLYDDGPNHLLVFAPTRSGKGVGLVIPNLLNWRGSVVVTDIKGENYELTSGFRQSEYGNVVLRFDPTASGTCRFNPLQEVRLGDYEVRDAQNIADILVDPNGDRARDHWDRTAHALLTALILHVLYSEEDKSLKGCAYALARPGQDVLTTLRAMLRTPHLPSGPHPLVASVAQAMIDKSDDERSGVLSTALSFLDLYRDPLIARATSSSDFRIVDLMSSERPVSLYLTIPASDLSRTRPLVRLLLNLLCRRLTETLTFEKGRPIQHYKHPMLLLLDEFPSLGKLPFFLESIAYLAGYGIRCVLVTQDLSQLLGIYGKAESLVSNCALRIAYTPNKPETAELLSQMAGQMTVHQKRVSRRLAGPVAPGGTITPSESMRRLLTPDEVMRLPAEEALLFVTGLPPLRTLRARYYEDPELQRRASIPAPH